MRIVELLIDELDQLSGVDAVALVETPAIEADFFAFKEENVEEFIVKQIIQNELFVERLPGESKESYIGRCIPVLKDEGYDEDQAAAICYDGLTKFTKDEFESYTDYPESATNAAKRALEWRDGHPDQGCGTRVGWTRANQLAKREPISEETIARMASFARHLQHEDVPYSEGCGGLMVDAWGGRAGIEWAKRKLEEIREDLTWHEKGAQNLAFTGRNTNYKFALNEEEQMVVGPLMIPDKLIFRVDENEDPYYVFFSKDTIKEIAYKLMKEKRLDSVNIEHDKEQQVDGYMVSSWIVEDMDQDKQNIYGFNFPEGTWMGQYKIENKSVWEKVKNGDLKGFSVEGFFQDKFIQAKKQK